MIISIRFLILFFYYFQVHLKQVVNPPFQKRKKGGQLGESLLNLKLHIESHHTSCCIYQVYIVSTSLHMFQMHNKSIYFENLALKKSCILQTRNSATRLTCLRRTTE